MRKLFFLTASLVFGLSLCASGVWAALINIPDVTLVQQWDDGSPSPGNVWQDVVGLSEFQTYNATYDTTSHVLTIFTNWGETSSVTISGLTFRAADLFLSFHGNGNWDAAIPLRGTNKGKVFYSPAIETSKDVVGTTAAIYGGEYTTNINLPGPPSFDVPVLVTSAASSDTVSVIWNSLSGNPDFSVAIDLDGVNTGGLDINSFFFLWGTSTCGNDVILGPLPPSLLLLGSGLLGLVGWRRFRNS